MLKVERVEKIMSSAFKLEDISFFFPKGYVCGLIGENGAGKTTLIRVLMGLYSCDGKITMDGREMKQEEAKVKDALGVIFEEGFFDKEMRLEKIGIYYGEGYSAFNQTKYLNYLERFQLKKSQRYKELSKGMKIKVQLAFALSHDARLFLFDEPTAGLDRKFREEFMDICLEIVSDGERSVMISSHITEDLDRIADYIAYMQNGKMLFFLSKEELCDRFVLVRGDVEQCDCLPKRAIVYQEKEMYSSSALLVCQELEGLDQSMQKVRPDIRTFMHYFVKGGRENAEIIAQKYLRD